MTGDLLLGRSLLAILALHNEVDILGVTLESRFSTIHFRSAFAGELQERRRAHRVFIVALLHYLATLVLLLARLELLVLARRIGRRDAILCLRFSVVVGGRGCGLLGSVKIIVVLDIHGGGGVRKGVAGFESRMRGGFRASREALRAAGRFGSSLSRFRIMVALGPYCKVKGDGDLPAAGVCESCDLSDRLPHPAIGHKSSQASPSPAPSARYLKLQSKRAQKTFPTLTRRAKRASHLHLQPPTPSNIPSSPPSSQPGSDMALARSASGPGGLSINTGAANSLYVPD